jgi:diacylglycerol O-acyltransferase / wax synthase
MSDEPSELRYESRMSDSDALMWTIEKDPLLRSTITAVSLLDGPVDQPRFTEKVDRASRLIPRLRQRVVGNPYSLVPPRWEVDPNFDLGYHLRTVHAGGEGSERQVLDLAQWVGMQGFDRARPLWELYLIDGLGGGRSALVQKLHHAISDGVGSIQIALTLFDLERDPSDAGPLPDPPEVQVLGPLERLTDGAAHAGRRQLGSLQRSIGALRGGLRDAVSDPAGSVRRAGDTVGSIGRLLAPATAPLSPMMGGRSLSVRFSTVVRPLDDLRRAAKAADSKLNDAFVAAVAGGLQRYHRALGAPVEQLRMTMPINVRTAATEGVAGNQFVPARFPVPMAIDDPVERMAAIRGLVAIQRGEPALALTQPLAGFLNRLPTSITTGIFGSMLRGVDFVTSNVPGAPIPLYAAGAEIVQQFPFGPLSGSAANITLLSWLDQVCIGVNVDPAAVTDPVAFHACLEEGFDEVLAVG